MIEVEGSNEIEELEITDDDLVVTNGHIDLVHVDKKLKLPIKNDASAPTVAFGDGDSGFYESVDDVLNVSINGTNYYEFNGYNFQGTNVNGPMIRNITPTYTLPSFRPTRNSPSTGIGSGAPNSMSLITGGVEGQRITETVGAIAHVLTGNVATPTTQTLTGAGAVDIVSAMTLIVTTSVDAFTLADGVEGQEKFIVMKTDAADGTLTPSNLKNGTTITFDDVGDSAHLIFMDGAWVFMGGTATLA